jgi:hypothetical protein
MSDIKHTFHIPIPLYEQRILRDFMHRHPAEIPGFDELELTVARATIFDKWQWADRARCYYKDLFPPDVPEEDADHDFIASVLKEGPEVRLERFYHELAAQGHYHDSSECRQSNPHFIPSPVDHVLFVPSNDDMQLWDWLAALWESCTVPIFSEVSDQLRVWSFGKYEIPKLCRLLEIFYSRPDNFISVYCAMSIIPSSITKAITGLARPLAILDDPEQDQAFGIQIGEALDPHGFTEWYCECIPYEEFTSINSITDPGLPDNPLFAELPNIEYWIAEMRKAGVIQCAIWSSGHRSRMYPLILAQLSHDQELGSQKPFLDANQENRRIVFLTDVIPSGLFKERSYWEQYVSIRLR